MVETFCASVNFKSLLLQHDDMAVVGKLMAIIEKTTKDHSHDPLAGIMLDVEVAQSLTLPKWPHQCITLSEQALRQCSQHNVPINFQQTDAISSHLSLKI
jgi:hypothetical protein